MRTCQGPGALGASVGSTKASATLPSRFGVVGPTRASADSAPDNPHIGASESTNQRTPDPPRSGLRENEKTKSDTQWCALVHMCALKNLWIRKAVDECGLIPGPVGLADPTAEDEDATCTAFAICRSNRWVTGANLAGSRPAAE
jgi:hypothetical protein